MAKRYMTYDQLPEYGGYKPSGTMGSHYCFVMSGIGDNRLILGSSGGKVVLSPGEVLGYNCGGIWKVPNPKSYTDSIRQVLAFARVPQRVLEYTDSPIRYVESYQERIYENSIADHETGEKAYILGEFSDATQVDCIGEIWHTITGGEAIIVTSVVDFSTTEYRRRKITRIIVRKNADIKNVAKWLRKKLNVENT